MTTTLKNVLTEPVLRRMAGARSFERGLWYFNGRHVRSVVSQENGIAGKVEGTHVYKVRLSVDRGSLDYSCTCPMGKDGECCKHCVALGLAWLNQENPADAASITSGKRSNRKPAVTMRDVRAYLAAQKTDVLVDLLMRHAEQDENLQRRLLMMAAKKAANGLDVATYRQAIEDAIVPDDFVSYDEMYDYTRKVDEVIDSIENLLKEGHAVAVIDLTEHALRSAEKAMESVDDSDGTGGILERLQNLHHAACKQAKPDPAELATRLFEWELRGQWDTFSGAVDAYADVLGKKGLEVYRQLAEQRWEQVRPVRSGDRDPAAYGERFRITQIVEALARSTGDVEAVVSIKQRDLSSSWAYLQIAEVYRKAKKHGLALEWAERGVKAFPQHRDARLRGFLTDEYHRRKRHDEAMALVWDDFEAQPRLEEYKNLKSHADKTKRWSFWRGKALDVVRAQIDRAKRNARDRRWAVADHSVLVEIFLWEKDFESAWREAQVGGCYDSLWRTLAAWREKDHPLDATPIYWKDVESALQRMGNESYREAVRLLRKIRALMQRVGQEDKFTRELTALRAAHKAKRNFLKLLDHAKWE